jgi:hypothetical protein
MGFPKAFAIASLLDQTDVAHSSFEGDVYGSHSPGVRIDRII